jgi:DNA-binding MarR family transcriptional regulator
MGLKLIHELWKSDDPTTGASRAVLMVLCLHARDDTRGDCWPSLATIARKAGINRGTVFKLLKVLESGGQIRKTGRVAIRRAKGNPDCALKQYVNQYRIGVFPRHTPSVGDADT